MNLDQKIKSDGVVKFLVLLTKLLSASNLDRILMAYKFFISKMSTIGIFLIIGALLNRLTSSELVQRERNPD
jgi:hypothetical protein